VTRPDPDKLARFLRQMREFGETEVVLDGLDAEQVRASLTGVAVERATGRPAAADTSAGSPAPSRRPDREAPTGSAAGPDIPDSTDDVTDAALAELDYDGLREVALTCTRCRLARERQQVVFSDGNPDARLMVVGEAPGANEDRTGLPFVGQAGQLLDLMLQAVDLSRRESVYICNVLKCRPPGNRNPMPDEIELCSPYLKRQIALVAPQAILAVGTFAAQLLTGKNDALGRLRGDVYSYEGVPLIVTYHPAALLRNPNWTRATWDDLQLLRQVID